MTADYRVRGVEKREEQDAKRLLRDPRGLFTRLHEALATPGPLGMTFAVLAVVVLIMPVLIEVVLLIALILWLTYASEARHTHLPMRLPVEYGGTDYNDPIPGRTQFRKARGIFFLGNEKKTNEELHLTADDMLTHMLVFGTTGSGKTESLLSLGWNSLSMGSGLIYIDPKGTNKLALQIWVMARAVGRDDDFLLINYSTGNRSIAQFSPDRISNTSNPFAHGTADFLSDIMNSLIPASEGENAIFSERAVALMKTLMMGLVEMRDQRRINLSVRTIRHWMTLEKCMEIAKDPSLSESTRASMASYLDSVAGFDASKDATGQGEDTRKQFGYAQAYFTRALSSLTDTYGHVYGSIMGEVDYRDVVFNRRILVVLLPSMEKAPPELKSLGKVVLASIRSAMAMGLGNLFEGDYENMIEALPSASSVPNLVIADEYGYVATEGFAVTAAQARGLGFSVTFAGQDFAGFKRGSETEAESIVANTKVKIVMSLEDAASTWDIVKVIGAESSVVNTAGFTSEKGSVLGGYADQQNASVERRARVDLLDLRDQIEGEFHVFHKAAIVRGQMFHADPPIKGVRMTLSRMLEIDRPDVRSLSAKYGPIHDLSDKLHTFFSDSSNVRNGSEVHLPTEMREALRIADHPAVRKARLPNHEALLAGVLGSLMGPPPQSVEPEPESVESESDDSPPVEKRAQTAPATPRNAAAASGSSLLEDDEDDDLDMDNDTPAAPSPATARESASGSAATATAPVAPEPRKPSPRPSQGLPKSVTPTEDAAMEPLRKSLSELSAKAWRASNGDPDETEILDRVKSATTTEYPGSPVPEPTTESKTDLLRQIQSLREKAKREKSSS